MKTFDWNIAETLHSPEYITWLKRNQYKPLTEEEYVNGVKPLAYTPTGKWKKGRQPHSLRSNYRNLRDTFGFFSEQNLKEKK